MDLYTAKKKVETQWYTLTEPYFISIAQNDYM